MPVEPQQHRPHHASREQRPTAAQRGYDADWRRVRLEAMRRDNCKCAVCGGKATCVDHIVPVSQRPELRLELSNLQSMCHACHCRKTIRQDGGFGVEPKAAGGMG